MFNHDSRANSQDVLPVETPVPSWMRRLGYYGLALLFVAAAAMLRWELREVLSPVPTLVFYLAWVGAAAFGGLGPGLLATVASWLCIDFLFDPTPGQISLADPASITRLSVLLAGGLVVSLVGEKMRRTRIRERRQMHELADLTQLTRQGQQRLSLAQQIAHVGTFDLDMRTGVDVWTPELEAMYGLPPGEFGKTRVAWEQLVHPDDRAQAVRLVEQSIDTGEPIEGQWRVVWPDGSVHWLAGRWQVFKDESGKPLRMTGVNIDITERKQAEEALRQSERRFKSTFENAALGIAHVALDGHILQFNSRFCEIASYLPEEILGKTCEEITFADDWKAEKVQMERLLDGAVNHYAIEKRYIRKDGSPVWVNLTRSLQRDEAGRAEYFIVLVEDITDRKRVEAALHEAREELEVRVQERTAQLRNAVDLVQAERQRFQNVLDQLPAYLVLLSPDYRVPFANRFFEERFGKCEGRRCYEYLFQRPEPCANCKAYKVLETKAPQRWEWTGPDGRDYDIHDLPFTDVDGSPLIMEVGLDITERKQAEKALRESEQRLKLAQQIARVGTFDWDIRTGVNAWTPALEALYGLPPGGFARTEEAWEHLIHRDDRTETLRLVDQAFQTGEPTESQWRVVWPDGSVHWVAGRWQVFKDEKGNPFRMTGVNIDITERVQAEVALQRSNEELTQRTAELLHRTRQLQKLTLELSETEDRERKRMAEILHDDLQQVLAGAKFHVGLMRNRAKYDSSLQAIGAQVEHMLKDAIDQSRNLSHDLSPAVLHHSDFAETLRWLANDIQAKHGLLVHVRAPGVVRSQSDVLKGFLYRAAQELLFNVVKHAGVREAEIRVRRCGEHICLLVSDHGRGFDPQELREAIGFGLLSIRERIGLLGGRMKIRSARGKGSTVLIRVPTGETAGTGAGIERRPNGQRKAAEQTAGEVGERVRVLLADDHEIVREGLRSLLSEEHDVEVVGEATNGREAVDLASQLKPDVIIMDVAMPMIEGDEATRQIKTYLPETRVIAMSMYDQAEKIEAMYRAGAESYVLKTAPSEELLTAIRGQDAGAS